MLFDLRGKGRRRTVQVIYLSLAILMGGGLVLFGIGGATNGGLFDAFSSNSGSLDTSSVYRDRIERYEKQLQTDPKNERALAELTRAQVQEASVSGFNSSSGTFSEDGIKLLRDASATWERYLDSEPKNPDPNLANLMVNAFGGGGLNDPASGAQAMAIVIAERGGTSALYSQLSILHYAAGNVRRSVLAEKNAIAAAEPEQRKLVKARLASQRKQIDRAKLSTAVEQGAASQGAGTTP